MWVSPTMANLSATLLVKSSRKGKKTKLTKSYIRMTSNWILLPITFSPFSTRKSWRKGKTNCVDAAGLITTHENESIREARKCPKPRQKRALQKRRNSVGILIPTFREIERKNGSFGERWRQAVNPSECLHVICFWSHAFDLTNTVVLNKYSGDKMFHDKIWWKTVSLSVERNFLRNSVTWWHQLNRRNC